MQNNPKDCQSSKTVVIVEYLFSNTVFVALDWIWSQKIGKSRTRMPHRMPHGDDRVDGQNSRKDDEERFVLLRQHHDTYLSCEEEVFYVVVE